MHDASEKTSSFSQNPLPMPLSQRMSSKNLPEKAVKGAGKLRYKMKNQ